MKRAIGYIRVSTRKQKASGLGMEAQQAAVESYAAQNGLGIVKSYTEVESGKNDDRPQLAQAIGHAKLAGAVLIVAKLDRLSRSVSFTYALMDAGLPFVCCDAPHANEMTIGIMAVMAQAERKAISERTRAALKAKKARARSWAPHVKAIGMVASGNAKLAGAKPS